MSFFNRGETLTITPCANGYIVRNIDTQGRFTTHPEAETMVFESLASLCEFIDEWQSQKVEGFTHDVKGK